MRSQHADHQNAFYELNEEVLAGPNLQEGLLGKDGCKVMVRWVGFRVAELV